MKMKNLCGVGAAMITPFKSDFSCDWEALGRMIDYVIDGGTDYIVALGTTAETPTLSPDEKNEVLRLTKEHVAGRMPIVAGAGGNDTRKLIEHIKQMDLEGVEALLCVTPYYNKATPDGLVAHYIAIAHAALGRNLYLHLAIEVLRGERMGAKHLFGSTHEDHFPTLAASIRPEVDNVVGSHHHILVVLYHDDRVSEVAQLLQCCDKLGIISLMKSYTRLVKYIQHAHKSRTDLCGKSYFL